MAQKKKFIQLGTNAKEGSFYDPTLKLKLLPGQMKELPKNFRLSKRLKKALAGGHLEYVDSEDVAESIRAAGIAKIKANEAEAKAKETEEKKVLTEEKLKKFNKPELKEYIIANGKDVDKESLEELSKEELVEEAVALLPKKEE